MGCIQEMEKLKTSQVALMVKNLPASTGDVRDSAWIPGSGRAPGEGNGNTPAFLPGKSHGRGAWQATVHRVAKSDTTEAT